MYTETKLSFCSLLVKDNIIVAEINEGITLNKELSDKIIYFSSVAFNNKPFVYISNRVNSYSVDRVIYNDVCLIDNLIGFAVVSKTFSARNAEIERLFLNKPFEIFRELDKAKNWADIVIKKSL